jgi:type I restriction enzyme S subunit
MAGETWAEISLADIVDVKHGFAFPGENIRGAPPGDILLTPGNFAVGGGFKGDKFKYFDGPVPEEYVLRENDLIVTMTDLSKQADTLGYPAIVPKPRHFRYLHNQRLGKVVIRDDSKVDKRFLSYLLRTHEYRHEILASATGTTVKHTSPSRILAFKTLLPPPAEQRAIAHVLGTLDDKIELNQRMNETLEAMARALFKSWFVDFDPVRAKAEGRDPGLPKHIADLFPDSFEDSELGEIPRGWEVAPLDNVLVLQRGFDLPSTQRTSGNYPVIAASGPSGTHDSFAVRGPGVTTGRSGVLGKVFYVSQDFWPLNTSLWVKAFRHSKPAYAFHLLERIDFALFNAGSAVPTLNRNHIHTLPTLIPPIELINSFEKFATNCLAKKDNNDTLSITLEAVRDSLLPRLISGELRLKSHRTATELTG